MSLGPVMVDLRGTALTAEEREMLLHPLVGGVILFTRNYESPEQLGELLASIHRLREPRLLVAVDHEGGRVQRFRHGFTPLPPARVFGEIFAREPQRARHLAETCGWLMAAELRAVGVDFSFAPVLDLDHGVSEVIGDRSFGRRPDPVSQLGQAVMLGMRRAGMAATGKHFPGHGAVAADSHTDIPVDERRFEDILVEDLVPFERLIQHGLAGVMPAHVIYPRCDEAPAGFSRFWLQEVLRKRLGFQGTIFSDDLSMAGAAVAGGPVQRAQAALAAGCDMLLVCNDPAAAGQVLSELQPAEAPVLQARLMRMHGRHPGGWDALHHDGHWRRASEALRRFADDPSLELAL